MPLHSWRRQSMWLLFGLVQAHKSAQNENSLHRSASVDQHGQMRLEPEVLAEKELEDDGSEVARIAGGRKPGRLRDRCGHPLLLADSGRSLDLVITFWTNQPEPTSHSFARSASSTAYTNLVYTLRTAERYGLLKHVRKVHILMDENVWTRDGAPHSLKFKQKDQKSAVNDIDLNLVLDAQIGVYFHQGAAKWSAIAKIPDIADWVFYLPDDVLLMDNFTIDDFWDKHALKPKMYSYDQSSAGWCDGGAPVGSFHGPVLLNRCFLDEISKQYSDKSYSPHSWNQNQVHNMEENNIDPICLYTKAVLDEEVAVEGGTPAWSKRCHMNFEASSEACSADDLLVMASQPTQLKFFQVEDAKLAKAAGIAQGTSGEEEHLCEGLKTLQFFRYIAGSAPMVLETSNGTVSQDEPWPPFCLTSPFMLSMSGKTGSSISAALMIVVLCLSLVGLLWVQRRYLQNSSRTELVATCCLLLYMGLTIAVDVLIRRFHQQGIDSAFTFKPAVMTLFIEIGKLVTSCLLALVNWRGTRECSWRDFGNTMLRMAVPGVCYVGLNLGRYLALSGADLDEYRVWRCTDIIFVALIWFGMFRKRPGRHEVGGIAMVFASCAMMHLQDSTLSATTRLSWPIMAILGLALVSSLGLVTNELGMKASADLSIFVQNIALYTVTGSLNAIVVLATVPIADVFQGIEQPQLLLIVLDVILGLCVACVLKYANAMVKQLASGWLAPLEPLVGHFLVGTAVTPIMVVSTVLAGAGTIIFRCAPTKKDDKEEVGEK